MFAVRPICVQDSIFKMSSESPEDYKLEQLERLRTEDTPATSWLPNYPYHWVMLDLKSKETKSKLHM